MLLAFHYDWINALQVTLIMIGADTPDLKRIRLLIPEAHIEATLGIPWEWSALHYLGGNLLVLLILALLVALTWRKRAFVLLALGAISHHSLNL